MKGRQFFNHDDSQGGRNGHICQEFKWCVELNGRKYHVDVLISGYTASTQHESRPKRKTTVSVCDGSCDPNVEIPKHIWDEAFSQIQAMKQEDSNNSPTGTEEQVATKINKLDQRESVLVLDLMSDEGRAAGINLEFSDRQ